MTALMVAGKEAAALLLMEATQKAGALDVQGGDKQSSALHYASVNGWESAVAKLLSLGADAALVDKVVAFLHVPHVHACPHNAPTNIRCPLQNVETYNVYLFSRIYCTSYT